MRGGFAAAWIIVSDEPVEFPRVTHPDILVAQAQDSINRFGDVLKPDGILIVDSDMVHEIPPKVKHLYKLPATTAARNEIKIAVAANMIMLGAFVAIVLPNLRIPEKPGQQSNSPDHCIDRPQIRRLRGLLQDAPTEPRASAFP